MLQVGRIKAGSTIELTATGIASLTSTNPAAISTALVGPNWAITALVVGQQSTLIQVRTDGSIVLRPMTVI